MDRIRNELAEMFDTDVNRLAAIQVLCCKPRHRVLIPTAQWFKECGVHFATVFFRTGYKISSFLALS